MSPSPAGSEGSRPSMIARMVERTAVRAAKSRTSGPPIMRPIALSPWTTFRGALTPWSSLPHALAGAAASSARCLIPRSILRSITSEPGSITSIPSRWPAAAPFIEIRFRLIRRVAPFSGTSAKAHTQSPASERFDQSALRLEDLDPHARLAFAASQHFARPPDPATRGGSGRRCACRAPTGSRSSRRCRRRRGPGPSAPATARPRTGGAPIVIARVATMSASASSSSPAASSAVAPQLSVRSRSRRR